MSRASARMRMFAGPNGSGKTTVQREVAGRFGPVSWAW
jgi:predicted ABC-type ATPase